MSSNKRKKKKKFKSFKVHPVFVPQLPPSSKRGVFYHFFDKGWKIIVAILLILGGIASLIAIEESWFKSPKEKFKEETTIEGTLMPPSLSSPNQSIKNSENSLVFAQNKPNFTINSKQEGYPKITGILLKDLKPNQPVYIVSGYSSGHGLPFVYKKGIDFFKSVGLTCNNSTLIFGIKDNRMYISTEFKRLQNEETMGTIEFNHWTLYKENILNFKSNDTMLEVRDKQNKIAFMMKYIKILNTCGVIFEGYFIGDTSITVVNPLRFNQRTDTCISKSSPNWKQNASVLISKIKSLSEVKYLNPEH